MEIVEPARTTIHPASCEQCYYDIRFDRPGQDRAIREISGMCSIGKAWGEGCSLHRDKPAKGRHGIA